MGFNSGIGSLSGILVVPLPIGKPRAEDNIAHEQTDHREQMETCGRQDERSKTRRPPDTSGEELNWPSQDDAAGTVRDSNKREQRDVHRAELQRARESAA